MSEPTDEESPLTPAEDDRIRRLLAEARHTEPLPDRMVERFDRVLAGLAAERAAKADGADRNDRADGLAPVVDLASRRRRTAATLLVAAAAVIVAGVGIGQILPRSGGSQDAATTAESAQDAAPGGDVAAGSAGGSTKSSGPTASTLAPTVPAPENSRLTVVRVRSAHFGTDVRAIRSGLQDQRDPAALTGEFAAPPCPVTAYGEGLVIGATYDGAPAALVLREPAGDVQVVDLYLCATTEPTRSITLTYP